MCPKCILCQYREDKAGVILKPAFARVVVPHVHLTKCTCARYSLAASTACNSKVETPAAK